MEPHWYVLVLTSDRHTAIIHMYTLLYNLMRNSFYSVSLWCCNLLMFWSFWHESVCSIQLFSTHVLKMSAQSVLVFDHILQDEADFYVHNNMWCYEVFPVFVHLDLSLKLLRSVCLRCLDSMVVVFFFAPLLQQNCESFAKFQCFTWLLRTFLFHYLQFDPLFQWNA